MLVGVWLLGTSNYSVSSSSFFYLGLLLTSMSPLASQSQNLVFAAIPSTVRPLPPPPLMMLDDSSDTQSLSSPLSLFNLQKNDLADSPSSTATLFQPSSSYHVEVNVNDPLQNQTIFSFVFWGKRVPYCHDDQRGANEGELYNSTTTPEEVFLKGIKDIDTYNHEVSMLLQVEGLPHCVRMLDFDIEPHFHISRNELVAGAQVPSYQQLNFIAFPRHLPWSPNASITSLYQISCFFRQLFHALLALHQRNIAHLDIKPQNLMIESPSNSSLVLIDFGLARYFTSPSQPFEGVGGTAGYASLEFWRQQAWNGAPDIYAAGVILGQCLEKFVYYQSLDLLGSPNVSPSSVEIIRRDLITASRQSSPSKINMIPTLPPKIKEAIDLLVHLLDSSPESRLDAAAALKHPFLSAATFEEFDDITVQDFSNQYPKSLIITINANSHRFNQLK